MAGILRVGVALFILVSWLSAMGLFMFGYRFDSGFIKAVTCGWAFGLPFIAFVLYAFARG